MTTETLTNGSSNGLSKLHELTPEQLKAARNFFNEQAKAKRNETKAKRKVKVASALGELKPLKLEGKVAGQQTDWNDLEIGCLFSESSEGFNPLIKTAKGRAYYLTSGKSKAIQGGNVYRVYL